MDRSNRINQVGCVEMTPVESVDISSGLKREALIVETREISLSSKKRKIQAHTPDTHPQDIPTRPPSDPETPARDVKYSSDPRTFIQQLKSEVSATTFQQLRALLSDLK